MALSSAIAAVVAVLGWALVSGVGRPAIAALPVGARPLVVVGLAGLHAADIDPTRTPTLWALHTSGASGALTIESVFDLTCPDAGWLAVGAGGEAAGPSQDSGCQSLPAVVSSRPGGTATITGYADYASATAGRRSRTTLGRLAAVLPDATMKDPATSGSATHSAAGPRCVAAIGPGAALAAADNSGLVARYWSSVDDLPAASATPPCQVTLIDAGSIGRQPQATAGPSNPGPQNDRDTTAPSTPTTTSGTGTTTAPSTPTAPGTPTTTPGTGTPTAPSTTPAPATNASAPDTSSTSAAAADARVRAALIRVGVNPGAPDLSTADVIVAGLADDGLSHQLGVLIAATPASQAEPSPTDSELPARLLGGPAILASPSTRQPALAQLSDVLPTLQRALTSHADPALPGRVLGAIPGPPGPSSRWQAVTDVTAPSALVTGVVGPFAIGWGLLAIAACILVVLGRWERPDRTEPAFSRAARLALVTLAATPAATFLAMAWPWWRWATPQLALVALVAALTAVIGAVAVGGPWRRHRLGPIAVVSAITVITLTVDVVTGSRLQLSAILGLNPVVGGRFFGLGNVAFAVFATALIVLAAALADPVWRTGRPATAALLAAVVGVVGTFVDAWPSWGADAGGPPALVPAVVLLALGIAGRRVRWSSFLPAFAVGALALAVLAVVDFLRPADERGHLGRFAQSALDGDAGDVVLRKLEQNLDLARSSTPLVWLIPLALLAAWYVATHPDSRLAEAWQGLFTDHPAMRHAALAITTLATIGLVLNDTGIAIPPVAAMLAVPIYATLADRTASGASRQINAGPMTTPRHG